MKMNNKGFSLVELIVVTAIFMVVLIITSDAFLTIQRHVGTQSRLAQSNIDGVIGLEILRTDLEAAGYGLFWSAPTATTSITYGDSTYNGESDDSPPQNAYDLTGVTSGDNTTVPTAVQSGNDIYINDSSLQLNGTDYLVLRGMTLPHNTTSQRWSYMTRQMTFATISSAVPSGYPLRINSWANNNLTADDKVVVITGTEDKDPANHRKLITNGSVFFTKFSETNLASYQPPLPTMPPIPHALAVDSPVHFIYGVHAGGEKLRMPYNRADYYVRKPTGDNKPPLRCAPDTGVLFKSVIGHASGTQTEYPLLDCVADFQVVYGLDRNSNGAIETVSAAGLVNPTTLTPMSAEDIRNQLKSIQVYILTHEGKKDTNFSYPDQSIGVGPGSGLTSGSGSTRTFVQYSTSRKNYRWKVYRLTVAPKNLLPAQK